jgi:hypothetical protein
MEAEFIELLKLVPPLDRGVVLQHLEGVSISGYATKNVT